MERLITLFRSYPVLIGIAVFLVIAIGVGIFIGTLMTRAGLSLKPLVFFYVFLGIIAGPQVVYHLLKARGIAPDLVWTPNDNRSGAVEIGEVLTHTAGKYDHPEKVFGAGFDPDLVSDVSRLFAPQDPIVAQMAIFRNAESVIVVRFPSVEKNQAALRNYLAMLGWSRMPQSDSDGSFTVNRGSDRARLFAAGKTLFIWTAADPAGLDRRMAASAAAWSATSAAPRDPKVVLWWKIMAAVTPLLILIASLWFFKGSSWAATVKPEQTSRPPATAFDLRKRLMELESLKAPITVTGGSLPNEVVVTWRADATWLDLARARGLRRMHKIVLQLDEANRNARVTEYSRQLDWSAGAGGGDFAWRADRGMVFFQKDHHRVYGLQLDPTSGRLTPALSYSYTFDLQEMKAPLINVVTQAGWTWKPVVWQAPAWLRWATE